MEIKNIDWLCDDKKILKTLPKKVDIWELSSRFTGQVLDYLEETYGYPVDNFDYPYQVEIKICRLLIQNLLNKGEIELSKEDIKLIGKINNIKK